MVKSVVHLISRTPSRRSASTLSPLDLSKTSLRWAVALGTISITGTPHAEAHPESSPALVNRYVTLSVHREQAELAVALLYGALPGGELRHEADLNKDQLLDERELRSLQERLQHKARGWLTVRVGDEGVRYEPTVVVDLGGNRASGAAAVVVEARAALRLPKRRAVVALGHGPPLPRQGETEVALALGEGWALEESTDGMGEAGTRRSFKFTGPAEAAREVQFTLAPTPAQTKRPGPLIATLAFTATGIAAWMLRRRHRSGMG